MDYNKEIAKQLLNIKAVKLSPEAPFTWASGIKSPIYTDNRLALSFPSTRTAIKEGLSELVRSYGNVDCVVGVATAGIPHAALIADHLELPMAYVRSKAKSHGRQNQIEGQIQPNSKVVVVEDLISTGGSALEAVAALKNQGIEVLGVVAIFTYGFQAAVDRFNKENCTFKTLTDYSTLIEEAVKLQAVNPSQIKTLEDWRVNTSAALA